MLTPGTIEIAITNAMENNRYSTPKSDDGFQVSGDGIAGPYYIRQTWDGYTIVFSGYRKVIQRQIGIMERQTRECMVCEETSASITITQGCPQNEIMTFLECGHSMCAVCFGKWMGTCPLCRAPVKMERICHHIPHKAAQILFGTKSVHDITTTSSSI